MEEGSVGEVTGSVDPSLSAWLKGLRLGKLEATFAEDHIELKDLTEMTHSEVQEWMQELPLKTIERSRFRRAIIELKAESHSSVQSLLKEARTSNEQQLLNQMQTHQKHVQSIVDLMNNKEKQIQSDTEKQVGICDAFFESLFEQLKAKQDQIHEQLAQKSELKKQTLAHSQKVVSPVLLS